MWKQQFNVTKLKEQINDNINNVVDVCYAHNNTFLINGKNVNYRFYIKVLQAAAVEKT